MKMLVLFRKTLIFMLIFAMAIGNLCFSVSAEEDSNEKDYVQVFFDNREDINLASGAWFYPEVLVEKDGVQTARLDSRTSIFRIRAANDLYSTTEPTPTAVTVRYLDEGVGHLGFRYSTGPTDVYNEGADRIKLNDTGEWKETTIYIDDMVYNRINGGYDLWVGWTERYGNTSAPVYIEWIKLERSFMKKPVTVKVETDSYGNTIGSLQKKELLLNIQNNVSAKVSVNNFKYEILSSEKQVLESGELDDFELENGELKQLQVIPKVEKYGCYYIRFNYDSHFIYNGEKFDVTTQSKELDFSLYLQRAEDEPLNTMMLAHSHHSRWIGDMQEEIELMKNIGIAGARDGCTQQNVEISKGVYSGDSFTLRHINALADAGMINLSEVLSLSSLYGLSGWEIPVVSKMSKEQLDGWCNYVDWISKHYKGKIKYYELLNEPNHSPFNPKGATAKDYADLAKVTYPIIKANDPDAIVCVFATLGIDWSWIQETINAGILQYCDAVSFHPYDWEGQKQGRLRCANFINDLQRLKKLLADNGRDDLPFVLSEMGATVFKNGWSEIGQAACLAQLFGLSKGEGLVETIAIYDFRNDSVAGEGGQEGNWGIVKNNSDIVGHAAKPSYVTLAAYNKFIGCNSEANDKIVRNDTSIYKFKRNADGKDVIMMWSDNKSESLGLSLGTSSIEIYDMYGNSLGTYSSSDGKYSFNTSFEPQYIIGNFADFTECEPVVKILNGRKTVPANDESIVNITDLAGRNLTVDVEVGANVSVLENNGMVNGTADVYLKTSGTAKREQPVTIFLKDENGQNVYVSKMHLVIGRPIEVSMEITGIDPITNRQMAALTIKNMADISYINGAVLCDTSHMGGIIEKRNIVDLAPQTQCTVYFNVPKAIVQRTFSMNLKVELDSGFSESITETLTKNESAYTQTPPPLTGEFSINDWKGGDWVVADDEYAGRYHQNWKNKDNCSFQGKVLWDYENLYLVALVKDNAFSCNYTSNNIWNGDSVQIALRKLNAENSIGTNTEIGIAKSLDGDMMYRFGCQTVSGDKELQISKIEKGEVHIESINGQLIYRCKIPWSEIFGEGVTVTENEILGFSMLLNDNDGAGRLGWVEYASGIGNAKDITLYSTMSLKK